MIHKSKCRKIQYKSKRLASLAAADIIVNKTLPVSHMTPYFCVICGCWHLSSQKHGNRTIRLYGEVQP